MYANEIEYRSHCIHQRDIKYEDALNHKAKARITKGYQ